MKSPATGKEMLLKKEPRQLEFRKEKFDVVFHYYWCKDSKESYTTTELDEINMNQVYNQYRDNHNLPFPDEIKKVREKYNLPATKMSEILGFGVNSYRNYESGEVPADANGKLIQLADDSEVFRKLVQISSGLEKAYKNKLIEKIDELIKAEKDDEKRQFKQILLSHHLPNQYSGYRKPSLERITEMVVFFTEKLQPWKTQMNKLLFYADFLNFKKSSFSISGMNYRAVEMGPIVADYNSLFDYISRENHVVLWETTFDHGVGEQFKPHKGRKFKADLFEKNELEAMAEVANKFHGVKTKQLVDISHKELAWKENEKKHELISYKYAFELSIS